MVVISTAALLTWAMAYRKGHLLSAAKTIQPAELKKKHSYDPALLRQFEQLSAQLDFNRQRCTYSGRISAVDGADTSLSAKNIEFLFCRHGSDFYYRVGNSETVHEDGINLFIQHEQRKVVLSDNPMLVKSPQSDLTAIEKKLRFEDYDLVSTNEGKNRKIAALNPTHITCKELALIGDTLSGKLETVSARFSNLSDPLNRKKDRVITITIDEIENKASLGRYTRMRQVIAGTKGNWRLTGKYADYELILL